MALQKIDWQCTHRCRSHQHGSEMAAVITCGTVHQIKTFIATHCRNPFHISDLNGRSLLHVAASCGKLEVVDWLLGNGADCRVKDKESGWTPLHRSLFFGQISSAIHLIRHGATLKRYDKEDLTPLDLLMKDKPAYVTFDPNNPTQAYSWGSNSNFNLGHGRQRSRDQPELIDSLVSGNHSIKQVIMCKFHTLFLTHQGRVLSCGHGHGGRLGVGDETTCLRPQLLKSLNSCKTIAGARDHSLFLMESGNVLSCGENTFHQLGHSSIGQKCLLPKKVVNKAVKNDVVIGIAAGRFHSVVYTKEAVFTFGLNAGQLGHNKEEHYIPAPRQVTSLSHAKIAFKEVVASDAATVCLTTEGDIYVLHEYQCRKVASNHLSVKQLAVIGGNLNAELAENVLRKQGGEELQLLCLHTNGKVLSWGRRDNSWRQCVWTHHRHFSMQQMAFNQQNVVFITPEGEGFMARFINKKNQDQTNKTVIDKGSKDVKETRAEQMVSLERILVIHRATGVACDPQGRNFVVLQSDPRTSLTELPELSNTEMQRNFTQLMVEADSTDMIHDVLIKIDNHRLAAHKYILAYGSTYFSRLFADHDQDMDSSESISKVSMPAVIDDNGTSILDLTEVVDYDLFNMLMQYLYTGTCDVFKPGFKLEISCTKLNGVGKGDPISGESYGIEELTINDRNKNQSAYSVYRELQGQTKKEGEGKKKGKKDRKKGKGGQTGAPKNQKVGLLSVVKMLIEEAKNFGIKSLAKRLENVKCVDGTLVNFGPQTKPAGFDRASLQHLSDVAIQSEEGELFPCHKCVLTARLDYFQSMLGSGWMEASTEAPLKMAMPASSLGILLDYIYQDQVPSLEGCQDLELLCNTLTIADQLFVTRLKDICEMELANLITLRNVAEVLQFASLYQAHQLKATCHQYMCLNLAALIEAGSLDFLEDDVLEDLSTAYKATLPYTRFIKPYMHGPDISHIDPYPPEGVTLQDSDPSSSSLQPRSSSTSVSDFESIARRAKAKRKGRRRTSSTGKHNNMSVGESGDDGSSQRVSCSEDSRSIQNPGVVQESSSATDVTPGAGGDLAVATPSGLEDLEAMDDGSSAFPRSSDDKMSSSQGTKQQQRTGKVDNHRKAIQVDVRRGGDEYGGTRSPLCVKVQPDDVEEERGDVTSAAYGKSWGWTSPKSPISDFRGIMQAQSGRKTQEHPQATVTTPTRVAPPLKSPLVSPTISPVQHQPSKGPTPVGKKSQKQRKREMQAALTGSLGAGDRKSEGGEGATGQSSPVPCPWGKMTSPRPSQVSFKSLQAQEEEAESIWGSLPASPPEKKTYAAARKISFGLANPPTQRPTETTAEKAASSGPASPESPKELNNPWQKSDAGPPASSSVRFSDIVRAESEQKDNLDKAKNKSLAQIQIEERAIEELYATYHAAGKPDEYITVGRVQGVMAAPLWKKRADGTR